MALIEKAKDLGQEIRNTPQYQELEKTGQKLREDESAKELIKKVEEAERQLSFSQQAGIEPVQEQVNELNELKEKMHATNSVKEFIQAQQEFNNIMEKVNQAISSGITGKEIPE